MGDTSLVDLLFILLSSVVVVSIFRSFKASPTIGYLLAGAIIGPHALGLIPQTELIGHLGEYGVVFLLFTLGLKMPLQRLQVLRRYVFGLGFFQVAVTTAAIMGICHLFDLPWKAAFMIGSALSLSSTAVSMQVLHERGEFAQRYGRVSFAILLFQDVAVVLLLLIQISLLNPQVDLAKGIMVAMIKIFVVLMSIVLLGRVLLRPLYHGIAKLDNAELFVSVTLLVVLLTAWVTHIFGLSMELGAFLAGLLLSETEYRHQVEADIQPFYGLLLGLFFMSVGMGLDFTFIQSHIKQILGLMAAILSLKAVILYFCCRSFLLTPHVSLRTSFLLASGGEFAFVLLKPLWNHDFIQPETLKLIYSVVALSMAMAPILASLSRFIAERKIEQESDKILELSADEINDLKNHVIIAGYGRVGKLVARMLLDRMIPFVILDKNKDKVQQGKAQGMPVFYGDARRVTVMKMLGAMRAKSIVLSLSHNKVTLQTALMIARHFPHISLSVRMRDNEYQDKLAKIHAKVVMPENLEPSLQLASSVLESMGTPKVEIDKTLENFRRSYQEAGSTLVS